MKSSPQRYDIKTELNRLTGLMRDPHSAYWKGPNAKENQDRFRRLLQMGDRAFWKGPNAEKYHAHHRQLLDSIQRGQ